MGRSETSAGISPRWGVNVIRSCMGVQRGEKVLIAVDEPLGSVRDALVAEALNANPGELWSYTFPNAIRPLTGYPPNLLTLAVQMDAIVLFLASLEPTKELPAWVAGREAIKKGKARFSAGAYIDQSILENELSADYQQIATLTQSLANWLRGCSAVHITTPLGTDLHLSTAGREWVTDTGMLRGQGVYCNLPAGEVFVAPVEDSGEEVLVIDNSLPGLVLSEPVRLVFEKGRVAQIEGGAGAEFLRNAITDGESKPSGEGARVIAELGIGTNPQARLQGNLNTDEKAAGTIHIAIGRNDFFGGKNIAPIHIDGVVSEPTVRVDGVVLIDGGQFLMDAR